MVVATEKCADLASRSAAQSGLAAARIVVLEHPVGGVAKDALEARGDAASDAVMNKLLGR